MALGPELVELVARARSDLRIGLPVLLSDEASGILVAALETLSEQRLRDMQVASSVELAITDWRARTLKIRAYDGNIARLEMPVGQSADWARAIADPALDLATPLKGPFVSIREGSADLHRLAVYLAKGARLLPAVATIPSDKVESAELEGITQLDLRATDAAIGGTSPLAVVAAGRVPLSVSDAGRVHVFRPRDGGEEHYAVTIGQPNRDAPVLVRLHSACFTGDVLGSMKCDCGSQLASALHTMGEEGQGILLYLNQEGRGIGLANKMRAYGLQDQGFDTVEANHRLGFDDDERDFSIGGEILKQLGVTRVRLMTNNPAKIAMMEACGINVVERVPLQVGRHDQNAHYLDTKAEKSGHLL